MDNELQQKVMNLINGAEQQIPEIAQEYLAWGVVSSYTMIVVGLIMLTIGCIFIRKALPLKYDKDSECFFIVSGIVLALTAPVLLMIGTCQIIKIKTAPKVYLIDSLRSK